MATQNNPKLAHSTQKSSHALCELVATSEEIAKLSVVAMAKPRIYSSKGWAVPRKKRSASYQAGYSAGYEAARRKFGGSNEKTHES